MYCYWGKASIGNNSSNTLTFSLLQEGRYDKSPIDCILIMLQLIVNAPNDKYREHKIAHAFYLIRLLQPLLQKMLDRSGVDVKALRAFRVLRPLRLVSGLPSKLNHCPVGVKL